MKLTNVNSLVNLYPEIIYDADQVAQSSLDIWNAYRIVANLKKGNATIFFKYKVNSSDTLTKLSMAFYGTDRLYWVIPLINDAQDPFDFLKNVIDGSEGDSGNIKVLKVEYLSSIIFKMKIIKETNDSFKYKQESK